MTNCSLLPEAHAQGENFEECFEYRKELGEEIPAEMGNVGY
ncbi:hypothetical protein ACFLX9_03665 [Chloroflexota bacterium]